MARQRIVVGLSGGVDSSTAAAILLREGHHVTGAIMRVWDGPAGAGTSRHSCYGPDEAADVADAARVAVHLGIRLVELDLVEEYRRHVLEYFRREYAAGRTPNPCAICNRWLKFGFMLERLEDAGVPFDSFATGHYVRLVARGARVALRRGADPRKDQTYFLAHLTQEQLRRARFPLGDMSKEQVRAAARDLGLPVAGKAESQDFASMGHRALLGDADHPGPIEDEAGRLLGTHRGISHFTVGQRKGLGVAAGRPLYVVAIDAARNAVVVGDRDATRSEIAMVEPVSWMALPSSPRPFRAATKIRHNHEPASALVTPRADGWLEVRFCEPQFAITPGQTAVFYDGDVVLAAGIIGRIAAA
jgi:tRNA-uridine 2-sulfurtransferase